MRVLIVEDSRVVREYLEEMLRGASDLEVLPSARDGEEGVRSAVEDKPDIILMDLILPGIDGIEAIGRIMALRPCPIIVLSNQVGDKDVAFAALQAGAVELVAKPEGFDEATRETFRRLLTKKLRLLAQLRVVRRMRRVVEIPEVFRTERSGGTDDVQLLAIGASTGGPPLLMEILKAIKAPARIPVLLAQHIGSGFDEGFAQWLETESDHRVKIPVAGELIESGVVLVAPADTSLVLMEPRRVGLLTPVGGEVTPNVNRMFSSVACHGGRNAAGVLLTGMGEDGAAGLLELRRAGGTTLAQDRESSIVYGMPRAAVENGAVAAPTNFSDIVGWIAKVASARS